METMTTEFRKHLNEEEVFAFVLGWFLQFGDKPTTATERSTNKWYQIQRSKAYIFGDPNLQKLFTFRQQALTVQLNQKGINLIHNYREKNDEDQNI